MRLAPNDPACVAGQASRDVDAHKEWLTDVPMNTVSFDLPATFRKDYKRITQVILRIIGDPARAEELAVDVFCKLWRTAKAHGPKAGGWLYSTAIRISLDELRRRQRREKYEMLFSVFRSSSSPEELHLETERQQHVRTVLSRLKPRDAALLLLRSDGLSYQEIAQTMELNPASIGTLLNRAEEAFRRRYTTHYGQQD